MSDSALTYNDLLKKLNKLSPEQLSMNVTVYDIDTDETFQLHDWAITGKEDPQDCRPESDVLDDNHPYLVKIIG